MGKNLILNLHSMNCQNNCVFCDNGERKKNIKEKTESIGKGEIVKLNKLNKDELNSIIISGNDPADYFDFVNFLKKIKHETDTKVFLQSYCNIFSDINFLKEVLKIGVINKIQIPIYGHNAEEHDKITQNKGSFEMVIKALENFKKVNFTNIQLHTLILKQNEDCLNELFLFLFSLNYDIDASLVCVPKDKNIYSKSSLSTIPDLNKVKIFFDKLDISTKNAKIKLNFYDIPFCLAKKYYRNIYFCDKSVEGVCDHFKNPSINTIVENNEIIPEYRHLVKEKVCDECAYDKECMGITKPYKDLDLFKPEPQKMKNEKPYTKIIKKTVIFTNYECNNQCIFCVEAEKRGLKGRSTKEIKTEMIEARKRGSTYLEFIGGEFTIRKDSIKLVSFASSLGFKVITMATNGRMCSYLDYAKDLVGAGLTNIVFSIHGHNSELHDELTQSKGSFKQLTEGLNNFKKLGFNKIGSNTTIVKQNYKDLEKIGNFIYGKGIRNSEFIFVDPNIGGAKANFNKLVPKISEIAPYVRKCLNIGIKNKLGHWHIRYVPLCYFTDYLDQISEIDEVKKFKTEHIAPDFTNLDVERSRAKVGRIKAKICRECKLDYLCEGIWREYVEQYGDKELIPVK